MSKGRMISSEIWEDDYFIDLTILERMIWIGLLTCSADDQGRIQDNVRLIRSQLFPVDDINSTEVETALAKFANDNKIIRYTVEGKNIIQIRNWWKYQSPRWCGKSKYKPPEGWIDRERYHGMGGEIVESNWKIPGGFLKDSIGHSKKHSKGQTTILDGDGDSDVDSDGEGDGEENGAQISPAQRMIESVIGLPPGNAADMKALDEIEALNPTLPDIEAAYSWLSEQGKQVRYYSSLVGPIRTAIAKRVQKSLTPLEKSKAAIRQVIAEAELNPEEASRGIFD